MKSFKNFLTENYELPLAHITPDGKHEEFVTQNLKTKETRDEINVQLLRATWGQFSNPHQALNRVAKLLAAYGILIPRAYFPAVDGGEIIWSVASSGQLKDYNPSVPGANITPSGYYVYFEYETDDTGAYIAYAEIVDDEGLSGLMEDIDEEMTESLLDRMKPNKHAVTNDNPAMAAALKAIGNIGKDRKPETHDPKYEAFKKQKIETRKNADAALKKHQQTHYFSGKANQHIPK